MVWYPCIFQNFPQFIVIHTVKGFGIVNEAEVDVFLELPYFLYDLMIFWQFDLLFLCLFETQLVHLEFLDLCTAEDLLEGF